MSESGREMKDIYDDAILQGCIEGAKIIKSCGVKKRRDGISELTLRHMSSETADRLAGKKAGDPIVAYGIASILYTSTVLYGEIGEKFLNEKLEKVGEHFSQEEFAESIAENVTKNYKGKRRNSIISGVKDALNNRENIEADAAKTAIMINEYRFAKSFKKEEKIQENYFQGNVVKKEELLEILEKSKYGEIDYNTATQNLNTIYNYLKQNLEKVDPIFKDHFPELSSEKLTAYFIAQLSCDELEKIKSWSQQV